MHRKALVVGINHYHNFNSLNYAERDATEIARRLSFDGDETAAANFQTRRLLNTQEPVTRGKLRGAVQELFANSAGLDLVFYFAGHGFVSTIGGYLVASDGEPNDHGLTMHELTTAAAVSQANSILLLLDCCHAGAAGDLAAVGATHPHSQLRENMTILAGSLPMQQAMESAGGGLFTSALRDALDGAAADITGEITAASVYSVVEKRFSLWQQRPVVKSYVTLPVVLRKVRPRLSWQELRRIVELFPAPDHRYQMDPDHDPERDLNEVSRTPEVPAKIEIGRLFKRYRDAALLRATVPNEDLYYVAQRSHTAELTLSGKVYWQLVDRRII